MVDKGQIVKQKQCTQYIYFHQALNCGLLCPAHL